MAERARPARRMGAWLVTLAILGMPVRGLAAELTVVVDEITGDAGRVLVALCTRDTFLEPDCAHENEAERWTGDRVEIVLSGVEPGVYAAQAFHDQNGNGEIERNLLGIPTEGIAFSNDAPVSFGPPEFDDAAIRVDDGSNRIHMRMRYLQSR